MLYMDDPTEPGPDPTKPPARPRLFFWILILILCGGRAVRAAGAEPPFAESEKKMLGLVNKDRKEHQKKPLAHDETLAKVARAHSADMMKNGFFAHKSPTTGTIGNRLMAAKFRMMIAGENIARNRSVERAEVALMKSTGHRENILRDVYTHVGIGIARTSHGVFYITQVFATPAPKVDLRTAGADVLKKLNKARIKKGKCPFVADATLSQLASEQARAAAAAGKQLDVDISSRATAAGFKHRRLYVACLLTWDPGELATVKPLLKPRVGRIGLGFAENKKHKKLGFGIIWAVVIFTND